ncbi:MAG: hypothetical protein COA82_03460 [Alkaliphilus sp.]|nr:MAG: hypothetical protein COA82_03460 [Alkaliphilus sp.]
MEAIALVNEATFKERYENALRYSDITPTEDQYNVIVQSWNWFFGDKRTLALKGYAGTGKSTTTNFIYQILCPQSTAISAPTHKAKVVLEIFTGGIGKTIHSLLGLKLNTKLEEFDINNVIFDSQNKPTIGNYKLILLDEASMLNNDLFDMLLKEATATDTKILFIGDPTQLPPVGERVSKAFTETDICLELTKPVRQNPTNPLYFLLMSLVHDIHGTENSALVLRQTLKAFGFKEKVIQSILSEDRSFDRIIELLPSRVNDEGEGYHFSYDGMEINSIMTEIFQSTDDLEKVRYLAFKNDNVSDLGRTIRGYVTPDLEFLAVGDPLMSYTTLTDSENDPIIQNSSQYVITALEDELKSVFITVNDLGKEIDIPTYKVSLRPKMIDEHQPFIERTVNVVKPPYNDFIEAHAYYHNLGKFRRKWARYYEFKEQFMICEELKGKVAVPYGTQLPGRDLDFDYSITVHKSQGSTYEKVIVNGKNINQVVSLGKWFIKKRKKRAPTALEIAELEEMRMRLYYVALSRASKYAACLIDDGT